MALRLFFSTPSDPLQRKKAKKKKIGIAALIKKTEDAHTFN